MLQMIQWHALKKISPNKNLIIVIKIIVYYFFHVCSYVVYILISFHGVVNPGCHWFLDFYLQMYCKWNREIERERKSDLGVNRFSHGKNFPWRNTANIRYPTGSVPLWWGCLDNLFPSGFALSLSSNILNPSYLSQRPFLISPPKRT